MKLINRSKSASFNKASNTQSKGRTYARFNAQWKPGDKLLVAVPAMIGLSQDENMIEVDMVAAISRSYSCDGNILNKVYNIPYAGEVDEYNNPPANTIFEAYRRIINSVDNYTFNKRLAFIKMLPNEVMSKVKQEEAIEKLTKEEYAHLAPLDEKDRRQLISTCRTALNTAGVSIPISNNVPDLDMFSISAITITEKIKSAFIKESKILEDKLNEYVRELRNLLAIGNKAISETSLHCPNGTLTIEKFFEALNLEINQFQLNTREIFNSGVIEEKLNIYRATLTSYLNTGAAADGVIIITNETKDVNNIVSEMEKVINTMKDNLAMLPEETNIIQEDGTTYVEMLFNFPTPENPGKNSARLEKGESSKNLTITSQIGTIKSLPENKRKVITDNIFSIPTDEKELLIKIGVYKYADVGAIKSKLSQWIKERVSVTNSEGDHYALLAAGKDPEYTSNVLEYIKEKNVKNEISGELFTTNAEIEEATKAGLSCSSLINTNEPIEMTDNNEESKLNSELKEYKGSHKEPTKTRLEDVTNLPDSFDELEDMAEAQMEPVSAPEAPVAEQVAAQEKVW